MSENGLRILRSFITTSSVSPGVYKMLNAEGQVIYIGKAKNIKSRLSDYLQYNNLTEKTKIVVSSLRSIESIVTSNEFEAILLESNLIKKYKPKYNILLKDGKSFPYICIDESSDYPKIIKHRGPKKDTATYWGPFPSASRIDEIIDILQKTFLLRTCTDNFFASRKRPCILYEMKRCSAPCVKKISIQDYSDLVRQVKDFLKGKDNKLYEDLETQMKVASKNMEYEKASLYRDRIEALNSIKSKQLVSLSENKDFDVIVIEAKAGVAVIEMFFIRDGINLGNKSYYFENSDIFSLEEILSGFIYSFYSDNEPGKELLLNIDFCDTSSFIDFIRKLYCSKVQITLPVRGIKKELLDFAINNARINLNKKVSSLLKHQIQFEEVKKFFSLEHLQRIEIYDNSHFAGDQQLGVMVVCGRNGFNKSEYRKYNIRTTTIKGDDYSMMREVLERRFRNADILPDLIIIDGGYGQLSVASKVLNSCGLNIQMISMAKGQNRNSGEETIYLPNGDTIFLDKYSKLKQYLQILRDEAHRFAITSNRKKMESRLQNNILKKIPGIGNKTQKILLSHFGSLAKIESAPLEQLNSVRGLSKKNAQNIYQYFRASL